MQILEHGNDGATNQGHVWDKYKSPTSTIAMGVFIFYYINLSFSDSFPPDHQLKHMDSPNSKSVHKYVKSSSHSGIYSTTKGLVRHGSPSQGSRNHSGSRDEPKDRQFDKNKVIQKPQVKENTKQQEFKLHTQERAVKRAIFNYSVATKFYIIEQKKKQLVKLQKMIEEEEVRLMRKEMIPRAQLMPFFDKPFFPQRSTRPLTVPREPNLLTGKCSSCIFRGVNFSFLNTMKPIN